MASTYTPIATQTLGSTAATVTFSSISGTYTDLVLVFNGTTSASVTGTLQFNSDTASNYSNTYLVGDGTSASSGRGTSLTSMYQFYPGTTISTTILNIMNYANTTTNKTVITRFSNTSNYALINVGLWRSTSAITSIVLSLTSGTFSTGSTFSLYGIKAA